MTPYLLIGLLMGTMFICFIVFLCLVAFGLLHPGFRGRKLPRPVPAQGDHHEAPHALDQCAQAHLDGLGSVARGFSGTRFH